MSSCSSINHQLWLSSRFLRLVGEGSSRRAGGEDFGFKFRHELKQRQSYSSRWGGAAGRKTDFGHGKLSVICRRQERVAGLTKQNIRQGEETQCSSKKSGAKWSKASNHLGGRYGTEMTMASKQLHGSQENPPQVSWQPFAHIALMGTKEGWSGKQMLTEAVKNKLLVDERAVNLLLKDLVALKNWGATEEIFEAMGEFGVKANVLLYSTFMRARSKAGQLPEALALFHRLRRDGWRFPASVYNMLIQACAQEEEEKEEGGEERRHGCCNEMSGDEEAGAVQQWALRLYHDMGSAGVRADAATFLGLLSAVGGGSSRGGGGGGGGGGTAAIAVERRRMKRAHAAVSVLREMAALGIPATAQHVTIAIKALGRARDGTSALRLFEEMKLAGVRVDVRVYGAVVDACARAGLWRQALRVVEAMEGGGEGGSTALWSSLVKALADAGQVDLAEEAVDRMMAKWGLRPNEVLLNCLLTAYQRTGEWERAEAVIAKMEGAGCTANDFCLTTLMSTYANAKHFQKACTLLDRMVERRGCHVGVVTWTACIHACAEAGEWQRAETVFERMRASGCTPNVATFGSLIHAYAYAQGSRWRAAARAFQEMRERYHIRPNAATCNGLLLCYGAARKHSLALDFFQSMAGDYGVLPDLHTFTIMVRILGEMGDSSLVASVDAQMQQSDCRSDDIYYQTLVQAYESAGRPDMATKVIEEMR